MSDKPKVVPLPKKKSTVASANDVLEAAKGHLSTEMVILGWNEAKDAIHILTPCMDKAALVYMLEYTKMIILSGEFENA